MVTVVLQFNELITENRSTYALDLEDLIIARERDRFDCLLFSLNYCTYFYIHFIWL